MGETVGAIRRKAIGSSAACERTLDLDLDYREAKEPCEPLRPLDTLSNFQVKGVSEEGALEKLRYQQSGRCICFLELNLPPCLSL